MAKSLAAALRAVGDADCRVDSVAPLGLIACAARELATTQAELASVGSDGQPAFRLPGI